MEQAQKNAKKGSAPQMDFDEWMNTVSKENVGNYKEQKYGIKKKR